MINNPISDMLTRVRNSNFKLKKEVCFPYSKFKWAIAEKLKASGYFSEIWTSKDKKQIKVKIKFFNKKSSIVKITGISKSSQRIYLTNKEIKKACVGKKTYFLTTSKGVMTHKDAFARGLGGELMFFVS